jgi:HD superfamily phosphohydrolase
MDLILKHKRIYDVVHGDIHISNWACSIIDTSYFQRLRYLHQLGVCYFVFPNGDHSRFEHSIGTYFLAGKILDVIKQNTTKEKLDLYLRQINDLNYYWKDEHELRTFDDKLCELIKIAALCHDLGHGPFSHVFDDVLPLIIKPEIEPVPVTSKLNMERSNTVIRYKKHKFKKHEYRSGKILEFIIKSNELLNININSNDIQFIQSLINPNINNYGFIYQIVSNSLNGLDVDKYDYLSRDIKLLGKDMHFDYLRLISEIQIIDNNICYPKQLYYEIVNLFHTRYQLHKMIYNHKAVIAIQLMITDIMIKLDGILDIGLSIRYESVEQFSKLTDTYLLNILEFLVKPPELFQDVLYKYISKIEGDNESSLDYTLSEAYDLYQRIKERNLYKLVYSKTSNEPIKYDEQYNDTDKYEIYHTKIGYVSGNKQNPLDNIYFYNTKDIQKGNYIKFKIDKTEVSKLIPEVYQEYILMIYQKN